MGSPPKNFNPLLESPYAKHLQQYPSQSEGYAPSEFGGKIFTSPSTPAKQSHQDNDFAPSGNYRRRGNNRYFNVNRNAGGYDHSTGGRGSGRGGGGGGGGYRSNYHGYQNNHNQQTSRYSNSGNRQQPYHTQNVPRSDSHARDDFFHPSMLEDPWKELLDRHNAIKNSRISEPSSEIPATSTDNQYSSEEDDVSSPKKPAEASPDSQTTTSSTNL